MVRRGEIRRRRLQSLKKSGKTPKPEKKKTYRFFIECAIPVKDGIFDLDHFEKFVKLKYKVHGKTDNLGNHVRIFKKSQNLRVHTEIKIPKRYIKFLCGKYLKKQMIAEWVRIVTSEDDDDKGSGYKLQYYPIAGEEEEDEESSDDD